VAPDRPFISMCNFFVREHGDKWAKAGTRFKPRTAASYPDFTCHSCEHSFDSPEVSSLSPPARTHLVPMAMACASLLSVFSFLTWVCVPGERMGCMYTRTHRNESRHT